MSGGGLEVEVRVVGGARSCFAVLPLHLIHALERTSATGDLPPVLALELHGPGGARWSLAWSGAASQSRAIEFPDLIVAARDNKNCMAILKASCLLNMPITYLFYHIWIGCLTEQ